MPIHRSKSPKAFQENIKREERFGKKKKQAVAIAYAEADRAKRRDAGERRKYDGMKSKLINPK